MDSHDKCKALAIHSICYTTDRKLVAADVWSEPLTGSRVPYVIVCGAPGTPLYHLVREPQDVLANPQLKLNTVYYVTRVILPPLHRWVRCLCLVAWQWAMQ